MHIVFDLWLHWCPHLKNNDPQEQSLEQCLVGISAQVRSSKTRAKVYCNGREKSELDPWGVLISLLDTRSQLGFYIFQQLISHPTSLPQQPISG